MSDDVVFVCRECLAETGDLVPIESVPEEYLDGKPINGRWVCKNGHVCGVWLDGGTLDLSEFVS